MTAITIPKDGRAVFLYLTIPGWPAASYATAAPVTFVCNGITKTNMNLDMGIFYAHPFFRRTDTWPTGTFPTDAHAPCFVLRLYPKEIATFTAGTAYPYTLTATVSGVKSTFTGTITTGGDITTVYLASTGNEVSVMVTDVSVATQIVETASPSTVAIGAVITVAGTLSTSTGVAIVGQTVKLQRSVSGSGVWADAGKTAITSATGTFSLTTTEAAVGTYLYRAQFAGATV